MRGGEGQGEGLLLTSYDRTLVVKQITSEDIADVHNILSEYHQVSEDHAWFSTTAFLKHFKKWFTGLCRHTKLVLFFIIFMNYIY